MNIVNARLRGRSGLAIPDSTVAPVAAALTRAALDGARQCPKPQA